MTDQQPDAAPDRTDAAVEGAAAPRVQYVKRYRMPRYQLWIGLGALLGLAFGLVLAATTDGPALVSAQRSFLWLGVFFAAVGALLGALAAVIAEKIVNR